MKADHIKFLVCTNCGGSLQISENIKQVANSIETGSLKCHLCQAKFPIIRHIPRFVPQENYAENFGLEWIKHAKTQYDSHTGLDLSRKRFYEETNWHEKLDGQNLLEVGCGAGRFTEIAAQTGAMVVSMDYSLAVEANYASNGCKENVLIVQADLYNMPFPRNFFDKVICIGVLQHTPDVKKAFLSLIHYVKFGGNVVVDVYRKFSGPKRFLAVKYWVRPITKKIPLHKLYVFTSFYINLMWPLSKFLHKVSFGQKIVNWGLLVADHRSVFPLDEKLLKDWAVLDTFDMLSPTYDKPQTLKTIIQWFEEEQLCNIKVFYGSNGGIVGQGTKPVKQGSAPN